MNDPDTTAPDDDPEAQCVRPLHLGAVPPGIEDSAFSLTLEHVNTPPMHFHVHWADAENIDGSPYDGWHHQLELCVASLCLGSIARAQDDETQRMVWDFVRIGQADEIRYLGETLTNFAALLFSYSEDLAPRVQYRHRLVQGSPPPAEPVAGNGGQYL